MRNRFNLSESEKNYIRGLHGIGLITEQEDEEVIATTDEVGDDTDVETITDEEIEAVENPEEESTWIAETWDDLTDAVKKLFSKNRKLRRCYKSTACPEFANMDRNGKVKLLRRLKFRFPKLRWPRIKLF